MGGGDALYTAVYDMKSLPLVLWLLGDKGADLNKRIYDGKNPLSGVRSLDILKALLDRGADATALDDDGGFLLMHYATKGRIDIKACLLQDPRVRATIDVQDMNGNTAFHYACLGEDETSAISIVHLLL